MNQEERRARRDAARRRVRRQRRVAAVVLAALLLLVTVAAVAMRTRSPSGQDEGASKAAAQARQPAPPQLPRGGREILPRYRVVGFYGAPQAAELGVLGIGTPTRAARKLRRQARDYRRGGRPVMPAFELIVTIVNSSPGPDGRYRTRQKRAVIRRYLAAARRAKALLVLDIQPGRADFMSEVRALRPYLEQPDVSLALDPEWSMRAGEVPGQTIGSTDAATVNEVSAYLADIVRRRNLPQKLLLVHQFTEDMIRDKQRLRRRPGVALTLNVDGFGDRPNKIGKYKGFTDSRRFRYGFKLFYREDTNLMQPRDVLRLRPRPDVVMYE
jgi:hypothetical protein